MPNLQRKSSRILRESRKQISKKQVQVAVESIWSGRKEGCAAVRSFWDKFREELSRSLPFDLEWNREGAAATGKVPSKLRRTFEQNQQNSCAIKILLTSFVLSSFARRSIVVSWPRLLGHSKGNWFSLAVNLFRIYLKHRAFIHFPDFISGETLNDSGVFLLNRLNDESRTLRNYQWIKLRVFAVDHPVDIRFRWSCCPTIKFQTITFIRQRSSWCFHNMRHLQNIQPYRMNFHGGFTVVQSTNVSSFIVRPNIDDLKSITEHGDAMTLKVEILVWSTPRRFGDGVGNARTF